MVLGSPARVVRTLDDETVEWKRNGTHVYQDLAVRSRQTLVRVEPLAAVEPDRPRVSTGKDVSQPLHKQRD